MLGFVGNDPETRFTQSTNKMVATFNVGTRESKDKTEWHKCIAWDKQAEFISKYFKKGSYIVITGHLQTRNYEDKDGKKTYVTEIVVESTEFGGNKEAKEPATEDLGTSQFEQALVIDDTLPF